MNQVLTPQQITKKKKEGNSTKAHAQPTIGDKLKNWDTLEIAASAEPDSDTMSPKAD